MNLSQSTSTLQDHASCLVSLKKSQMLLGENVFSEQILQALVKHWRRISEIYPKDYAFDFSLWGSPAAVVF
jgi:hypothetical protein